METIKQPCWVSAPTTREKGNKLKSFLENRGIDTHFYSMYMDFVGLYVLKNNEIISEYSTRERGGKSAIAAIKNTYPEMEVPEEEIKCIFQLRDEVLVRNNDYDTWSYGIFSHIDNDGEFVCVGNYYLQCISLKGNEHLLGTDNNPE